MLRAFGVNLHHKSHLAITFFKKSEALKQSLVLAVGNFVTAGLMAVATIVLARVLGPEQFGVYSVVVAVLFLLVKFIDLGLHQLIPRLFHRWQSDLKLQAQFMIWVQSWKVKLSLSLVALSAMLVPWIQTQTQVGDAVLLWLAVIGAVLLGWYEYVHLSLSAKHSFTQVSLLTMLLALVKFLGFLLVAVFLYANSANLASDNILRLFIAIYCLAPLVSIFWWRSSWWKLPWQKQANLSSNQWNLVQNSQHINQKQILVAVKRFLPHALVGTVAMTFIENIDILLVNNQLNAYETGLYSGAVRVTLAISLLTYAISSVLNNRVTRYNTPSLLKSYLKKSSLLSLVAVLGMLVIIPLAEPIIFYTIGPNYLNGLIPFTILVGNAFLGLALVPYTSFFFKLDVPWANSVGGLLQVATLVMINLLFLNRFGIMAAALARVVATVIFAFLVIWLVGRSWRRNFVDAI
jgi:O-antigen/teichoic acid export membrane protein